MEARIMSTNIKSLGSFVWSIAELLRGDFKQSEYGKVILPFVVLRRLDCILDSGKYLIGQQGGGLGHAAGATTGAEPALLAGKRYKPLEVAFVAAHPEKAVLEAAALQVGLEFPVDMSGRDLPCWASWSTRAG
jgi:type I restriction-modification system DNA methylase subunit